MNGYNELIRKIQKAPNVAEYHIALADFFEQINLPYDAYFSLETSSILLPSSPTKDKVLKRLQNYSKTLQSNKGRDSVFAWGKNEDGCCGHKDKFLSEPRAIGALSGISIIDLSCGMSHSLAISSDGRAFVWGLNNFGQCGIDLSIHSLSTPTVVNELLKTGLKAAACGGAHSVAITNDGEAYSWGLNSLGQCGFESSDKIVGIRKISIGCWVKAVACGLGHTVYLDEIGQVYASGWNANGQLGLGDSFKSMQTVKTLRRINIEEIIHIACGGSHTIFITVTGKAYSTGLNSSGQLGLMHVEDTYEPKVIETLSKVQATFAACGEEFSFIITYDKEVYGMGLNNVGQLGIPPTDFSYTPIPLLIISLTGKQIESISCGKAGSIAINEEGEAYNWGIKPLVQSEIITEPKRIEELKNIGEIKSGREFYLILKNVTDPIQSIAYSSSFDEDIEMKIEQTIHIQCVDTNGNYCNTGGDRITCIATDLSQDVIIKFLHMKVKDNNDGSYDIKYSFECIGKYMIFIICNGRLLGMSPYFVNVAAKVKLKVDMSRSGFVIFSKKSSEIGIPWYDVGEDIEMILDLRDKNGHECESSSFNIADIKVLIDSIEYKKLIKEGMTIRFNLTQKGKHKVEAMINDKFIPIFTDVVSSDPIQRKKHEQVTIEILAGPASPSNCKLIEDTFKIPACKEITIIRSSEIHDYWIACFDNDNLPTIRLNGELNVTCEKLSGGKGMQCYVNEPEYTKKPKARVTFKAGYCDHYVFKNYLEKVLIGEFVLKVINGRPDYLFSKVYGDICYQECLDKKGDKLIKTVFVDALDSYINKCEYINWENKELEVNLWDIKNPHKKNNITIVRHKDNTYKAEYEISEEGEYRIEVLISGRNAIGSPYEIKVKRNPIEVEKERKAQEEALRKMEEMQRLEQERCAQEAEKERLMKEQKEKEEKKKRDNEELMKRKKLAEKIRRLEEFRREAIRKREFQAKKLNDKLNKKRKKFKHCGGGFVVPFLEEYASKKDITLKLQNFFSKSQSK